MPHFTAPNGIPLWYEEAGEGLPVLCLAGLTRNARDFDFVAPHLPGIRMIRMDCRGRGRSGHAEPSTYDVEVETRDALALLDHLELDRVAVLGTSRGGLIGMMMAATHKDRLIGLAMNDVGAEVNGAGLTAIRDYVGKAPEARTLDEAARDLMRKNAASFPGVPLERWRAWAETTLAETEAGLELTYDPRLAEIFDAEAPEVDTISLWPLFEAVAPLPRAVIHGENSDLLPRATVEEMARRDPGLIVAHVPDRAHVPFLDEPEALAALTAWLEQMK
ncbi:MAG: alpha/beta fold hydrolase [Pseudooceanicola sp.]